MSRNNLIAAAVVIVILMVLAVWLYSAVCLLHGPLRTL